jgi:hypothetical protein
VETLLSCLTFALANSHLLGMTHSERALNTPVKREAIAKWSKQTHGESCSLCACFIPCDGSMLSASVQIPFEQRSAQRGLCEPAQMLCVFLREEGKARADVRQYIFGL